MIGVFDSGIGGLTTLKELQKILPEADYLYLGDTANSPYGKRSVERVRDFTEAGVEFLFQKGAEIVLIACNTASTDALRFLQEKYRKISPEKKVLGVLIPAVEQALENSRYGNIGLIATEHTVRSGNFEEECLRKYPEKYQKNFSEKNQKKNARNAKFQKIPQIISVSAPLLVPLIEEGWSEKPETMAILKKYILPLTSQNIDTLILGCTHYPILEKMFSKKMGKNCTIINSGKAQAEKFLLYLKKHPEISEKILKNTQKIGTCKYFTTDCPEKFSHLATKFLGKHIQEVKKVAI